MVSSSPVRYYSVFYFSRWFPPWHTGMEITICICVTRYLTSPIVVLYPIEFAKLRRRRSHRRDHYCQSFFYLMHLRSCACSSRQSFSPLASSAVVAAALSILCRFRDLYRRCCVQFCKWLRRIPNHVIIFSIPPIPRTDIHILLNRFTFLRAVTFAVILE